MHRPDGLCAAGVFGGDDVEIVQREKTRHQISNAGIIFDEQYGCARRTYAGEPVAHFFHAFTINGHTASRKSSACRAETLGLFTENKARFEMESRPWTEIVKFFTKFLHGKKGLAKIIAVNGAAKFWRPFDFEKLMAKTFAND
jgi:hypothetical protein